MRNSALSDVLENCPEATTSVASRYWVGKQKKNPEPNLVAEPSPGGRRGGERDTRHTRTRLRIDRPAAP